MPNLEFDQWFGHVMTCPNMPWHVSQSPISQSVYPVTYLDNVTTVMLFFKATRKSSGPCAGAVWTNPVPLPLVTWSASRNGSTSVQRLFLYEHPWRWWPGNIIKGCRRFLLSKNNKQYSTRSVRTISLRLFRKFSSHHTVKAVFIIRFRYI